MGGGFWTGFDGGRGGGGSGGSGGRDVEEGKGDATGVVVGIGSDVKSLGVGKFHFVDFTTENRSAAGSAIIS